jgi:fatty acid desaturase
VGDSAGVRDISGPGIEWITVALGAAIASLFGIATWFHDSIPTPITLIILAYLATWWSSYQHELIHGHPFRSDRINWAIGLPSIALWLPFHRYRREHLLHHRNERLTDPFDDPETFYVDIEQWRTFPSWKQVLFKWNRTLLGRLTVGVFISLTYFVLGEVRAMRRDPQARRDWALHIVVQCGVCYWVFAVCGIPVLTYLAGAVLGGRVLMNLRSFTEHRWSPEGLTRSAVVEAEPPLALLFLNNNLHHAHHAKPGVPWYALPAASRTMDAAAAAAASDLYFAGYREVAGRFLVHPFCFPMQPSCLFDGRGADIDIREFGHAPA